MANEKIETKKYGKPVFKLRDSFIQRESSLELGIDEVVEKVEATTDCFKNPINLQNLKKSCTIPSGQENQKNLKKLLENRNCSPDLPWSTKISANFWYSGEKCIGIENQLYFWNYIVKLHSFNRNSEISGILTRVF